MWFSLGKFENDFFQLARCIKLILSRGRSLHFFLYYTVGIVDFKIYTIPFKDPLFLKYIVSESLFMDLR